MNRAIFLDRDGVINELCYNASLRLKCAPFHPANLKIITGVTDAIKAIHQLSYLAIIISNQPDVGLGFMTMDNFLQIRDKMRRELEKAGTFVDFEYYCMHHPEAILQEYRECCDCHKPKPGLLLNAAREHDIDLGNSWFVGDNLTDVEAGNGAGCKTILITDKNTTIIYQLKIKPDAISSNLQKAVEYIIKNVGKSRSTFDNPNSQ